MLAMLFVTTLVRSKWLAAYLILSLVFPEEDVEGSCKAPHGEHQEQQGPLHIIQNGLQSVHKGVLGGLKHPAGR